MKTTKTLEELRILQKLERLSTIEPSKEFWDKFAESQIERYKKFTSVRDTGESI